jgi:hypothetical protein
MPNDIKSQFLKDLTDRFGKLEKIGDSLSLFKISGSSVQIYIRYSKTHKDRLTFYGLRQKDLQLLEGNPSLICFLWEQQTEPLFIPFADYEDVFLSTDPADDGQYKVQIILNDDATELYIARAGRFNVDGFFGWEQVGKLLDTSQWTKIPDLSHSQIQTILGSIGIAQNLDIWIPPIDRTKLDWKLAQRFTPRDSLPYGFEQVKSIISEVDVIWLQKGSNNIRALFEIEHSTPIYSGLLRFNDIHLIAPDLKPRFSIVAYNERRSLFTRQLNRPTFKTSGLGDLCTFFDYKDVYRWYERIAGR